MLSPDIYCIIQNYLNEAKFAGKSRTDNYKTGPGCFVRLFSAWF